MNMIQEQRDALRRLGKIVGREIDFHGGNSYAWIVGLQRRKHEMKKPVGVFEVTLPGVEVAMDQLERGLVPMDGEVEQPFRLLLRSHMADFLDINPRGFGLGSRNESRRWGGGGCRLHASRVQPFRPDTFEASDLITGDRGKGCKQ